MSWGKAETSLLADEGVKKTSEPVHNTKLEKPLYSPAFSEESAEEFADINDEGADAKDFA